MLQKSNTRTAYIDFEFNQTSEPNVNLVCCAVQDARTGDLETFWLHNNEPAKEKLRKHLSGFDEFVSYAAVAEGRSFLALGLDPRSFKWIDLFFEYRCISNHNDNMNWGQQLVEGKVKFVKKPPPKWERTEEDKGLGFRPTCSLAEATFKLTGQIRDTDYKNKMRDLIISNPPEFLHHEQKSILDYCAEDVVFLPNLYSKIVEEFQRLDRGLTFETWNHEANIRGRYAAHTAAMEAIGYPIDVEKTRNFSKAVQSLLTECQRDINLQFPKIRPFKWEKSKNKFRWDQSATKAWVIEHNEVTRWLRTDKGGISLSLDAFQKFYDFKHDYPRGNFGAQMVRYLKLKQNLYGFAPSEKKRSFWDSVGSDGRVRPYMNPFGAQSSRSQPGATGFLFLKPAWMRALCVPQKGKFIAGIDYGSQEILIQALDAEDYNMIEAYVSGDPYLFFAIQKGLIPKGGTKASHKVEREAAKSTFLGLSYLMTKVGLAAKLSADTGKVWTEDDAQEMIDGFYETFEDLGYYQRQIVEDYQDVGFLKLPDGWYIFGDNDNPRSVTNVPTQGKGAAIMRRAVDLAYDKGVRVIKTLHDAIYIEGDVGNERDIILLGDAMREAFIEFFPKHLQEYAAQIRLDANAWGPDYEPDSEMEIDGVTIELTDLYIDGRAKNEYKTFSKYFLPSDSELI